MFYAYIIQSLKSGQYYIGQTNNILKRLKYHNSGRSRFTKIERPWKLVYKEEFPNRSEVMKREQCLKSLKKRISLEKIIQSGVEQ